VKCKKTPAPSVASTAPASLDDVKVVPVTEPDPQRHFLKLLKKHHYLGSLKPVGERMFYAAVDAQGRLCDKPSPKTHLNPSCIRADVRNTANNFLCRHVRPAAMLAPVHLMNP
jgi:hypothetical protein